jgi:transcriptional regulatory protein RtcR
VKRVAIGLLGSKLDSGFDARRWDGWRPSVSLFQHEELLFDRFELLAERQFDALQERVAEDIRLVSPETTVVKHFVDFGRDPWDLATVYGALHDWARGYDFDPEKEEYWIHITTGTHIAQISLFLLVEAGFLPGKLVQTSPRTNGRVTDPKGRYAVIDLDLSKYDALSTRFAKDVAETTDFLKSGIATRSAGSADRADRGGEVAPGAADLRTQEAARRDAGKLRRDQLRHADRRHRGVGLVRACPRVLHRGAEGPAGIAAGGGRRAAVPR